MGKLIVTITQSILVIESSIFLCDHNIPKCEYLLNLLSEKCLVSLVFTSSHFKDLYRRIQYNARSILVNVTKIPDFEGLQLFACLFKWQKVNCS